MRSLFIVSLPRSLTSFTYKVARHALGLAEPDWTTDGEILNQQRFTHYHAPVSLGISPFLTRERYPDAFDRTVQALDRMVVAEGFAYKDVLQPFVVSAWFRNAAATGGAADGVAVLKIIPDLVHVAYTHLEVRGWYGPAKTSRLQGDTETRVLDGLLRGDRAIRDLAAESVDYNDIIESEAPLAAALRRLYPQAPLPPLGYIADAFVETRRELAKRRARPAFQRLAERLAELRFAAPPGTALEVSFAAQQPGRGWLWKGWSGGEEWGTWSCAEAAEIVVPLARRPDRDIALHLRFIAYTGTADHPVAQRVRISTKGRVLGEARATAREDNVIDLTITRDLVADDDYILLDCAFPAATAPCDVGESADDRKLGIGLVAATIAY